MSDAIAISDESNVPPHFIYMTEPPPQYTALKRERASTDLLWQVIDSARGLVDEPVRLMVSYMCAADLPDTMFHNDLMIVSQRMRECVEPWLKDYEFFQAQVELNVLDKPGSAGGGEILDGYWWLNCWRRLDLVDWEKSEMALYPTPHPKNWYKNSPLRATKWIRLSLNRPIPEDEHFFGIAFVRGERRYVSPALHRHIKASKLRVEFGVRMFSPPNDPSVALEIIDRLNHPVVEA